MFAIFYFSISKNYFIFLGEQTFFFSKYLTINLYFIKFEHLKYANGKYLVPHIFITNLRLFIHVHVLVYYLN